MANKNVSVWTSIPFWRRSAAWVTGFATILLIWLSFDTLGQISMNDDIKMTVNGKEVNKRVPGPAVINYKIGYEMSKERGHEVPTIGEKQPFFGKEWSNEEAAELLHLGKLTSQSKNCMNCHTLLGNGAYYAPDLTKAWLDKAWQNGGPLQGMTGKNTVEEAMSEFLQHPSQYPTHERMMPDLGITEKEAQGLVAFLKHMSSIDTNGFPRGFSKTTKTFEAGGSYAH
jgi:nitric oxide reductase subunit C